MPESKSLRITIGNYQVQSSDPEELPVSIDYILEDSENFESKKSSEALDVDIPAILMNELPSNTFRNADIEDLTTGQAFKSAQPLVVENNGYEIMVGKAFLKKATHTSIPINYSYSFLGDNADWLITLADKTLYDFLSYLTFTFDKTTIEASWLFDGTDELLPYVFAPVRFRFPVGDYFTDADGVLQPNDDDFGPVYTRPSLAKYWILFHAFKSVGYKIESNFLDSEYFRRQVMPWTFGNFLDTGEKKLESHQFLAKSVEDKYFEAERGRNGKLNDYVDLEVTNDFEKGAFDNNTTPTNPNGDYTYDTGTFAMTWTYNAPDYGPLNAAFSMVVEFEAALSGNNSSIEVRVDWFINGVFKETDIIIQEDSLIAGTARPLGQIEVFFKTGEIHAADGTVSAVSLNLNDTVSAKVHVYLFRDKFAPNDVCHVLLNVLQFQLDYFRVPIGGEINFTDFTGLQKWKFIDFLAGVIDEFDLSINTDSTNKIVVIEPTHPYSTTNDLTVIQDGYFKSDHLDWNGKDDLTKNWEMENYADREKELTFKYKDDGNDGILKLIQDRNINILASGKFVFPDRFQIGTKDRENRFFSPTMHCPFPQWTALGADTNLGITPQMVCIIPENISNTSESESDNTFEPKSCYYKGLVTGAGAWRWDGVVRQDYPYMFSVNYQAGGEEDPILSYCDELITGVIGKGLLKRFFWQRLAIMRNGQRYTGWFKLKNIDIAGQMHREFKSYKGQKWELIQIKGYRPLAEDSCSCLLYKWTPVTSDDNTMTFPSATSVSTGAISGVLDIKYAALMALVSDIPK